MVVTRSDFATRHGSQSIRVNPRHSWLKTRSDSGKPSAERASSSSAASSRGYTGLRYIVIRLALFPSHRSPALSAFVVRPPAEPFRGTSRSSAHPCGSACIRGSKTRSDSGQPSAVLHSSCSAASSRGYTGLPAVVTRLALSPSRPSPALAESFVSVRVPSWFDQAEHFRGTSRSSAHPCESACIRG